MSGVRPRLSGLSTHLPSLRSSFTAAGSLASTAVIRSLYFGPEPRMASDVAADGRFATRTTAGAGVGFCFAAAALGFGAAFDLSTIVFAGSAAVFAGSGSVFAASVAGFAGSITGFAGSAIGTSTFGASGAFATGAGAGAFAAGGGAGVVSRGAPCAAGIPPGRFGSFIGSYGDTVSVAIFPTPAMTEGSTSM